MTPSQLLSSSSLDHNLSLTLSSDQTGSLRLRHAPSPCSLSCHQSDRCPLPPLIHSNKDAGHPRQNILIKSFRLWTHLKVGPHFLRRHTSHLKTLFMESAGSIEQLSSFFFIISFDTGCYLKTILLRHLTIEYNQCNLFLSNPSLLFMEQCNRITDANR